jgi:protein-disulfide isomerase
MSTNGDDRNKKNPNAPKESKKSTREKAQAAREAAEAEQRRRDRRIRIIGGVAILAAVALIVGVGYWGSRSSSSNNNSGTIVADAKLPTGALAADNTNAFGVPYKTNANKPVLAIWEDFQCPICGDFEKTSGAAVQKLADDGTISLIHRPTTFLDQAHPESNSASARATAAWGCAIDAGKSEQYHNKVFSNQPSVEGTGWTDDQLMQFGKDVGITGDAYTTFTKCYSDKTYTQWTTNSYQTFINDGVAGTPTLLLNGKEIPLASITTSAGEFDPAKVTAYIQQNSGS